MHIRTSALHNGLILSLVPQAKATLLYQLDDSSEYSASDTDKGQVIAEDPWVSGSSGLGP